MFFALFVGTTEAYIFPLSSEDTLRQNPQDKKGYE